MIDLDHFLTERARVTGFLEHAEHHVMRRNFGAVAEALEDAIARLEALRRLLPAGEDVP